MDHDIATTAVGIVFLVTYIIILSVAYSGFYCILRSYAVPKKLTAKGFLSTSISLASLASTDDNDDDERSDVQSIGVTIIRPIKGIDPEMYTCLKSSFEQQYPSDRIQILLCVDDAQDPLIPLLHQICSEYPDIDLEVLVGHDYYGPNPKVNNLYKGVERAKFDLLWIMDSNVWANRTVLRNSVLTYQYQLNNGKRVNDSRKVKLVHHVPTALSISSISEPSNSTKHLGAELDEMFLLTSHSKFYILLNNLSIAPCVNGKLNLYSKADITTAVLGIHHQLMPTKFFSHQEVIDDAGHSKHIDFFARYIGEDNMIGIGLWEQLHGRTSGLTGDIVVQPLGGSDNLVKDYIKRRVRWLRVRKYMVLMATLVEPLTESLVCGIYGTVGVSVLFWSQWFKWQWFVAHVTIWVITDYIQYQTLIGIICQYRNVPTWLRKEQLLCLKRPFLQWLFIWMTREVLALPIWVIAMIGHEIDWRGRPFRIKKDLTAEEL